ncbi:MAG: hypothetical protein AAF196_04365 [Planctomycetota bacterium]
MREPSDRPIPPRNRTRLLFVLTAPILWMAAGCGYEGDLDALVERARAEHERLEAEIDELFASDLGSLKRPNGFVYAVDVGQLLDYAALAERRDWYEHVRQIATDNLIVLDDDDPFTRGFVLWRFRPGDGKEDRDATGTTEALRIAEGLWHGAEVFDRPEDRELSIEILRGYQRHEGIDQGVWLIRNYFQFASRGFATNSFLIDIDPDFVREVADTTGDEEFAGLADRMTEQIESAVSPSKLLHSMIQPEVITLSPEPGAYFSPNNVEHLGNSLNIAEQCVSTNRGVAENVLEFAVRNLGDGKLFFDASTGRPVLRDKGGTGLWAPMARLAALLEDRENCMKALWRLVGTRDAPGAEFWVRGERLLAYRIALDYLGK